MPWQLDTSSPIFKSMSPAQQQQVLQQYGDGKFDNAPLPVQQEGAQLQQTQASTQATQESAANIAQQIATQKRQLQQQQFQADTQNVFSAMADKSGHVSPSLYNKQKQQAASLGIAADDFDKLYEHNYTDPTSMEYNTGTGFANQNAFGEIKRQIQAQIDQYNAIPQEQKGLFGKGNIADQNIIQAVLNGAGGEKINELTQGKNNYLQQNAPQALGYEVSKAGLAAQLKGLIGGTGLRITQPELTNWQNLLPSAGDTPEVAKKKLSELDSSIKSTFNSPIGLDKDYLPKENSTQAQGSGGNFLSSMLNAAGSANNMGVQALQDVLKSAPSNIKSDIQGAVRALPGVSTAEDIYGGITPQQNLQQQGQTISNIKDVLSDPKKLQEAIKNNAFNLVAGGVAGGLSTPGEVAGAGDAAASAGDTETMANAINKLPGNFRSFLDPSGAISKAGNIRNTIVQEATDAGKTINGNTIVNDIRNWGKTAIRGNLGQSDAVNKAIQDAEVAFGKQKLTPQEAAQAYAEADSGYTKTGIPKTPIQANIDRGLRDILSKRLDQTVPGWQQATTNMAKSFEAQKSPIRAMAKNAIKYGLPLAGAGATGDIISHVILNH